MNKLGFSAILILATLLALPVSSQERKPDGLYATIVTNKGVMEFELYKNVAPVTISNFINLATRGFYDGLVFHRVENDFMVQGGDPAGDGSGGPGYEFQDEVALRHNTAGILSMANSGPDTNGSQFFITHLATPHLNGKHTVFGKIMTGIPVIFEIRRGDVIESIVIEGPAKQFLEKRRDLVYQWNLILDEQFPGLRPALTD